MTRRCQNVGFGKRKEARFVNEAKAEDVRRRWKRGFGECREVMGQ